MQECSGYVALHTFQIWIVSGDVPSTCTHTHQGPVCPVSYRAEKVLQPQHLAWLLDESAQSASPSAQQALTALGATSSPSASGIGNGMLAHFVARLVLGSPSSKVRAEACKVLLALCHFLAPSSSSSPKAAPAPTQVLPSALACIASWEPFAWPSAWAFPGLSAQGPCLLQLPPKQCVKPAFWMCDFTRPVRLSKLCIPLNNDHKRQLPFSFHSNAQKALLRVFNCMLQKANDHARGRTSPTCAKMCIWPARTFTCFQARALRSAASFSGDTECCLRHMHLQ